MKMRNYILILTLLTFSGTAHATLQCRKADFPGINLNQRISNISGATLGQKDHLCGKVNVAYHWAQKLTVNPQYSAKWYEALYWCTKKLKYYSYHAAMDYAKPRAVFTKSNPAWQDAWPVNFEMYDYAGFIHANADDICLGSSYPPIIP